MHVWGVCSEYTAIHVGPALIAAYDRYSVVIYHITVYSSKRVNAFVVHNFHYSMLLNRQAFHRHLAHLITTLTICLKALAISFWNKLFCL